MEPLLEGLEKTSYHERNTRVKVFGHGFKKSDILNEALNQARVAFFAFAEIFTADFLHRAQ